MKPAPCDICHKRRVLSSVVCFEPGPHSTAMEWSRYVCAKCAGRVLEFVVQLEQVDGLYSP